MDSFDKYIDEDKGGWNNVEEAKINSIKISFSYFPEELSKNRGFTRTWKRNMGVSYHLMYIHSILSLKITTYYML